MYKRNEGLTDNDRLQNQFTAYLRHAVHNGRADYLSKKSIAWKTEIMLEDMDYLLTEDSDFVLRVADGRLWKKSKNRNGTYCWQESWKKRVLPRSPLKST